MDIFGLIRSVGKRANHIVYYYAYSANQYYRIDENTIESVDSFDIHKAQIFTFISHNTVIFSKFTCEAGLKENEIAQYARIFAFEEFSLNPLGEYIIFYEPNRFLSSKHHSSNLVYNIYIADTNQLDVSFTSADKYIDFAYFAPHVLKLLFDDIFLPKRGVFAFLCLIEKSPFLAIFIDGELQYVGEIENNELSAVFIDVADELNIDNIEAIYAEKHFFESGNNLLAAVERVSRIELFSFTDEIHDVISLVLKKGFENQSFNFSTKQRPKSFIKRKSGQFITVFATSFVLFFIYPFCDFLLEYRKIINYSQQTAKINSKEAEVTFRLRQASNEINTYGAEIKTLQTSLISIDDGIASINNIKTNRAYGVQALLLLVREAKKFNILFNDFCLTPLYIGLKVESQDAIQITSFAGSLTSSGFAVTIFDIKKDSSRAGYVSRLNMEASGVY